MDKVVSWLDELEKLLVVVPLTSLELEEAVLVSLDETPELCVEAVLNSVLLERVVG